MYICIYRATGEKRTLFTYLPSLVISKYNSCFDCTFARINLTMAIFPLHAATNRAEQPLLSPPVLRDPPSANRCLRHLHFSNRAHTHIKSAFSKKLNLLLILLFGNFTTSIASANFLTLSLLFMLARSRKRRTKFCSWSKTRLKKDNLGFDCCLETLDTPGKG